MRTWNDDDTGGVKNATLYSPNLFLSMLLKEALERTGACRCTCECSLELCPPPTPSLMLFDCFGCEPPDRPAPTLQAAFEWAQHGLPVALYNLPCSTGVETYALRLGIRGFFYENDGVDTLTRGVAAILNGEVWVSRRKLVECLDAEGSGPLALPAATEPLPAGLSKRESEILSILAAGKTNADIAQQLYLSPHTVRTHIYNIFRKIGVKTRCEALLWAAENLSLHAKHISLS